MRITPLSAVLLFAAGVAGGGSTVHGQASGAHVGGYADVPVRASGNAATIPASARVPADSALLTGALGTRSPSGAAVVVGTTVHLAWSGDAPGATRTWAVHRGTCSRDAGVFGEPGTYPPLRTDARGSGAADAVLTAPVGGSDPYFVAVHAGDVTASATSATRVACGPVRSAAAPGADGAHLEGMGHGATQPSTTPPAGAGGAGTAVDHAAMGHGATDAAAVAVPGRDQTPGQMDHAAMGHGTTPVAPGTATGGAMPDVDMHVRMMADPVIRQRVMADTAMHRMMMASVQRMPAEHRAHVQSVMHGGGDAGGNASVNHAASGSAMPVRKDGTTDHAGTATRATPRPTGARPSATRRQPSTRPAPRPPVAAPHAGHGAAPAPRAAAPARTSTAPRSTPKLAPRDSMATMDHSKHQMPRP